MSVHLLRMSGALLDAEAGGGEALGRALRITVPFHWPPEHHDEATRDWLRRLLDGAPADRDFAPYYILAEGVPVGTCGFKGPPDADGRVDVGYSVVASEQRKGHAGAALRSLVAMAFADLRVASVVAETLPDLIASQRTALACGLVLTDRRQTDDGEILTFAITREAHQRRG